MAVSGAVVCCWGRQPCGGTRLQRRVAVIGDHPHVIIEPTGHRLARKAQLALSDLAGETFLTREPGSRTHGPMEHCSNPAKFVRPSAWR
jgi:LysR family transcriptional regulator for metE and metH